MPLTSKQKAALVLRIAVARYLDDYAAPPRVPGQRDVLDQARARLRDWVSRSNSHVNSFDDVQTHLERAAATLRALLTENAEYPSERIEAAILAIQSSAAGVLHNDGDGVARTSGEEPRYCKCGFLELAHAVEDRTLTLYIDSGNSNVAWPEIAYVTILTADDLRYLDPFKFGGSADISSKRKVTLTIKDEDFSAIDLCQATYVLFHELVCHAFQGVAQSGTVGNAKPQCHWTEGWMDAVAFGAAIRSATQDGGVLRWLPLTGPDCIAAMGEVHNARYKNPIGLKVEDAKERRAARKAFTDLQAAFCNTGIAASESDAEALARSFSLLANTKADSKTLVLVSTHLQNLLLSEIRKDMQIYAANACLEFLDHHSIDLLLAGLQSVPSMSSRPRG